jgi:hypothetical protein
LISSAASIPLNTAEWWRWPFPAIVPGKGTNLKPPKKSEQASSSEAKPYQPTPFEVEAARAYFARREKSGPRLKVTTDAANHTKIAIEHPYEAFGQISLMKAIGTSDSDFYGGLICQLVDASRESAPSEKATNFMLAVVKGIEPRDQIEAMLAAQMAAVHMASMTFARRLAHAENIPQQDSAERAFNKLTRTFAAQMSALKEYRSKGEQKMTVQHVHVAEGGQAIAGNVSASTEGVGAREKKGEQPHALAYAPGIEMLRSIEKERATVPSAGRAGE